MKHGIEDIREESKKVLEQYSSKEFERLNLNDLVILETEYQHQKKVFDNQLIINLPDFSKAMMAKSFFEFDGRKLSIRVLDKFFDRIIEDSNEEFQLSFCIEPHYQKIVDFLEI